MELALQTLSNLAAFVLVASLKSTLLVVVVLLIQKVAGSYLSGGARYLLWFPVVIALITPVGVNLTLPTGWTLATRVTALAPVVPAIDADSSQQPTVTALTAGTGFPDQSRVAGAREAANSTLSSANLRTEAAETDTGLQFSWFSLLEYLWLAGVVLVLGTVATACHRFSRSVQRATPAPDDLQLLLQDCMQQTSCKARISVLYSADIQVPMIAGLFNPVLLLPEGMDQQVTRAQLRHVFIHELMHLQRGDIVCNWIVALVQALHWFNPFVWFAFYCMRQDRELACDAATLRHFAPEDRAAYGHTLLQLNDAFPGKPVPAIALGMLESTSHLQGRIRMLGQTSRHQQLQSVFATLLLIPLAAVAFSQPVRAPVVTPRAPGAESAPAIAIPAVIAESTPLAETAPIPVTQAEPGAASSFPVDEPAPAPAIPGIQEIPVSEVRPVEQALPVIEAVQDLESPTVAAPPLAQLDVAPLVDVFEPAAAEGLVLAALGTAQPEVAVAEPATDLLLVIQQMKEEINALKANNLRLFQEWNSLALDCEASKDDSLFGTFTKPCREVRVVQLRGDVFHFVYACYVLDRQHTAQWNAWQEAVAQQRAGLDGVEEALLANAQELGTLCSKASYENQYPGLSKMLADAEALKYYNPWRRSSAPNYQTEVYANSYYWGSYQTLVPVSTGDLPGGGSMEYIGPPVAAVDTGGSAVPAVPSP